MGEKHRLWGPAPDLPNRQSCLFWQALQGVLLRSSEHHWYRQNNKRSVVRCFWGKGIYGSFLDDYWNLPVLWNCLKIKVNNNNNRRVTLCRDGKRKRPWGRRQIAGFLQRPWQRCWDRNLSCQWGAEVGPAWSPSSESPSAGRAAWSLPTWVGEAGDLCKQVFLRKAFREHEESRGHSALQVLIQGWAQSHILIHRHDLHLEKQDVQRKTSWSGAWPNLGANTHTATVLHPQPWRCAALGRLTWNSY